MAKVLYISIYNDTDDCLLSNGVMRKINQHLECLRRLGNEVSYTHTDGKNIYLFYNGEDICIGKNDCIGFKYYNKLFIQCKNELKRRNASFDYIYIRHIAFSARGFNSLKYLKSISNCIYLEYPTFCIPPKNLKNLIKYHYEKHLHRYVYRAVVDSLDKTAYGMPTLRIINGTDLTKIEARAPTYSDTIHVILMAYIQDYHGVDKIINATEDYYKNGGNRDVVFHIVGEGLKVNEYMSECSQKGLEKHIVFYGKLNNDELSNVLDKCEIGISSLKNKEIGVTCSSTLKSKEYLAKGLPIISDTMLDVFVDNPKYFFYELKDNFNFKELLSFYDSVYKNRDKQKVISDIRSFAEETCDMFKVFSGVHQDYLEYCKTMEDNK